MPLITARSLPASPETSPVQSPVTTPKKNNKNDAGSSKKDQIFSPPKLKPDFSPFKQSPFRNSSPLRPIPNFRSSILSISNVTSKEVLDEQKAKTKDGYQHIVDRLQENLIREKTIKNIETHFKVSEKVEKMMLMKDLKESLRVPRQASPVRIKTPPKLTGPQLMNKIKQEEQLQTVAEEQKKAAHERLQRYKELLEEKRQKEYTEEQKQKEAKKLKQIELQNQVHDILLHSRAGSPLRAPLRSVSPSTTATSSTSTPKKTIIPQHRLQKPSPSPKRKI